MAVADSPIVIVDYRIAEIEHQIGEDLSEIGQRVMSVGRHLAEARQLIAAGEWTNWVQTKTSTKQWSMSIRTAQNMIRTYETFKDRQFNPGNFTATALYALAYAGDDQLIDEAIQTSESQHVDKKLVDFLQKASPTIKERFLNRELNQQQAASLANAVKQIGSPRVKKLAEEQMIDGAAAKMIDEISKHDASIIDVAEATGQVYVSEHEVVSVKEVTVRDLTRHAEDIRREEWKQQQAMKWQLVINGRMADVVSVNHKTGEICLQFKGDLEDIKQGENLRISMERQVVDSKDDSNVGRPFN